MPLDTYKGYTPVMQSPHEPLVHGRCWRVLSGRCFWSLEAIEARRADVADSVCCDPCVKVVLHHWLDLPYLTAV